MKPILVGAILLLIAAPVAAGAPDDPMMPQECLEEPDAADCLGQAAKCIVREQIQFLYECWGILGP